MARWDTANLNTNTDTDTDMDTDKDTHTHTDRFTAIFGDIKAGREVACATIPVSVSPSASASAPDMGGSATTREMGQAIEDALA